MCSDEKDIVSKRQQKKASVTATLIESAQEQADRETEVVQAARAYLNEKHGIEQFPLMLDMYWKLQAGMEVKPEIESHVWFAWANQALGGFGSHIPRPLRQRVARELCQATFDDLQKEEHIQEIEAVIAEAKKESEQKQLPPPWAYEKGELILSLIGNEPFTSEMIGEINQVKLKVKNKETEESADVSAKVVSYQISAPLSASQEDMGLKREVIVVVRVARDYEDKFLSSIKGKCKGFKVERIECFRSPSTQGKLMVESVVYTGSELKEMVDAYLETALWSSTGDNDQPLDENKDYSVDVAPEFQKQAAADCKAFIEKAGDLLEGLDLAQVGHDFWLTRNHHGAGFWDGDYKEEAGDKLTDIAQSFPEVNPYEGDDGKVHAAATEDLDPHGDKQAVAEVSAMTDEEIVADLKATFPGQDEEIQESFKRDEGPWSSWGDSGEFKQDGEEWCFITSYDEAERIATEHVEAMLNDEPELFSQDFLKDYLSVPDAHLIASEDADAYVDDLDDARVIEEAEMQDEYDAAADDEKEGIVEQAKEKLKEKMIEDKEQRMNDDPVQFFVHDEGIYSIEDLMKASFISIDKKAAAEAAVSIDGWSHFLNSYDGNYQDTAAGMVVFRSN